jgi:DNA-binding beta-propeller fold protein YncE
MVRRQFLASWMRIRIFGAAVTSTMCVLAMAQTQESPAYPMIETERHVGRIFRVAVDPTERWVVTVSDDKTARVWDVRSGRLEQTLRPPIGAGSAGELFGASITPDGNHVALGGYPTKGGAPVHIFDRASGRMIGQSREYKGEANSLAYSPDGKRLAVSFTSGSGVYVLDATNVKRELVHHTDCNRSSRGVDFDTRGHLITSCEDGILRLYDSNGKKVAESAPLGGRPRTVKFSPDDERIAVAYYDTNQVLVLSRTLEVLTRPDITGLDGETLGAVAWSSDGQLLRAAGGSREGTLRSVLSWSAKGAGRRARLGAASDRITAMATLSGNRILFASIAHWGVIDENGRGIVDIRTTALDHRGNQEKLKVSGDGLRVEFGYDTWNYANSEYDRKLARFDVAARKLETEITSEAELLPPRTDGIPVTDWDSGRPRFRGEPIKSLRVNEVSEVFAAARNGSFALGLTFTLRSYDPDGRELWQRPAPAIPLGINLSPDGRFLLAALGDGTLRWYDARTGEERFALFINAADQRWVLFTPEGFYDSSPGGDNLLGYHLNRSMDREAEFVDSSQLANFFYRPDLISRRLAGDEAPVARALRSIGDVRTVLAEGLPPALELLSPARAQSDGEYELSVRIKPGGPGHRIGEVRLFINGAEVPFRSLSPPGGGVVSQRLALAPGANTIGVRVMRADGKVSSNEVIAAVNVRPAVVQPALRVLAVGISQYDDAAFKKGVKFAAADAEAVVKRLREGAAGLYREVDWKLLTSRQDTTLAKIELELQALAGRARPEDVVVIFLAGHGKATDGQYHFIPADFIYDSDDAFKRGKSLSHQRLEVALKSLGAGKRLLILDTCDSGTAVETRSGTEQKDALMRLMRSTGRYILAAASPEGKALEDGVKGHGVYTSALIEGLTGAAKGTSAEMIDVDALAQYVSDRVPQLTEPAGYKQRPMRSAQGDNFPLVRRVATP